jgi:hypothetical protein
LGVSILGSHECRDSTESTATGPSIPGTECCVSHTDFCHDCISVPSVISSTTNTSALCDPRCSKSLIDIHSAQLLESLNALEKKHHGSNFTEMLILLQEAGLHTLDDVLLCGQTLLVVWTGLPSNQVATLCDHSEKLNIGKSNLEDGDTPTSDSNNEDDASEDDN